MPFAIIFENILPIGIATQMKATVERGGWKRKRRRAKMIVRHATKVLNGPTMFHGVHRGESSSWFHDNGSDKKELITTKL